MATQSTRCSVDSAVHCYGMGCHTEPAIVHSAHALQKLHFFQIFNFFVANLHDLPQNKMICKNKNTHLQKKSIFLNIIYTTYRKKITRICRKKLHDLAIFLYKSYIFHPSLRLDLLVRRCPVHVVSPPLPSCSSFFLTFLRQSIGCPLCMWVETMSQSMVGSPSASVHPATTCCTKSAPEVNRNTPSGRTCGEELP